MGATTYEDFIRIYDIPYSIVTVVYAFLMLVFAVVIGISQCACSKPCNDKNCCSYLTSASAWLVRLVFGKSEGVSEDKKGLDTAEGIYINRRELNNLEVNILGAIIVCFGFLVAIAAYGAYLLEITHICSEDTAIYCFPLLIAPNTSEVIFPEDYLNEAITNCTEWTDPAIAPFITFQCFRYALNANAALVVAGGLLAFFTVAMRVTISVFTKVFTILKAIFEKCCRNNGTQCLNILRYFAAYITIVIDIVIALVVMMLVALEQVGELSLETMSSPIVQQGAAYITEHGIQVVIATGTVALLLLIDWTVEPPPKYEPSKQPELTELRKL